MMAFFEAMMQGALEWHQPLYFWGLLLPLALYLLQKTMQHTQRNRYADAHLWPWLQVEKSGALALTGKTLRQQSLINLISARNLLVLSWIALIIALAGPKSLDQVNAEQSRNGVDVLIDIDVSQSMTAEDVQPNRLQFAKSLSESLVNQLGVQDRVALNVFAGQAHAVLPLTHDHQLFKQALKTVQYGLLPLKGSWLELALIHDLHLLNQSAQQAKVLVVFTDGAPPFWKAVDLPEAIQKLPEAELKARANTDVKVIYIGVGLKKPSTIPDADHKSGQLHSNGILVQSRLEAAQMQKLAKQTGGVYLSADGSAEFMQRLTELVNQAAQQQNIKTEKAIWHEYALPFVWISFVLFLFATYGRSIVLLLFSSMTHLLTTHSANGRHKSFIIAAILALLLIQVVVPNPAIASSVTNANQTAKAGQDAYAAFNAKEFEKAESLYDGLGSYDGYFGAGSAAYRLGDLEGAVLYFRQAAWQATSESERAQALYNLGNSYYQANLLELAIESYEQALIYQSPYANAEHNLALAKQRKKLEEQGQQARQGDGSGEGEGEGDGQGKGDNEGAFYGGQKPSGEPEEGFGGDGDSDQGNRHGEQVNLPKTEQVTNYRLNPSIAKLRLQTQNNQDRSNSISPVLQKQRQQQRAEKFAHELLKIEDDQALLLKRLFEREAGFEALQEKAHPIPGVQPW